MGWRLSAATTAFTKKGRKLSFTPAFSAAGRRRARSALSAVTSHSSTNVKCAAVCLERVIPSKMRLRTPRSGIRSSSEASPMDPAPGAIRTWARVVGGGSGSADCSARAERGRGPAARGLRRGGARAAARSARGAEVIGADPRSEGVIVAAALPRAPRARTSSLVTRPLGPVGWTARRSIPSSRARARVAGVARGLSLK